MSGPPEADAYTRRLIFERAPAPIPPAHGPLLPAPRTRRKTRHDIVRRLALPRSSRGSRPPRRGRCAEEARHWRHRDRRRHCQPLRTTVSQAPHFTLGAAGAAGPTLTGTHACLLPERWSKQNVRAHASHTNGRKSSWLHPGSSQWRPRPGNSSAMLTRRAPKKYSGSQQRRTPPQGVSLGRIQSDVKSEASLGQCQRQWPPAVTSNVHSRQISRCHRGRRNGVPATLWKCILAAAESSGSSTEVELDQINAAVMGGPRAAGVLFWGAVLCVAPVGRAAPLLRARCLWGSA